MIEIKDLTFTYSGGLKPSIEHVDLAVNDSEMLLVTGPSGSGKSTLIRCLNGLVPHFYGGKISGKVAVQGMDPMRVDTKRWP